jgi:hypothetical protein
MPEKKKIVISCYPDGTSVLEGKNFEGKECDAAMKDFEKLMGKRIARGNNGDIHKQGRVNVQQH